MYQIVFYYQQGGKSSMESKDPDAIKKIAKNFFTSVSKGMKWFMLDEHNVINSDKLLRIELINPDGSKELVW